jgi:DNA-binding NtrC family response regulator
MTANAFDGFDATLSRTHPRLLFIDDDLQAQRTLRMILDEHYDVAVSCTGHSGFKRVQEDDPDLVLLEIDLPDQDGLGVLERINATPSPPPVVVLAMNTDPRLVVRAIKAGAHDFLAKPFDLEELHTTLRAALLSSQRRAVSRTACELDTIVGDSAAITRAKELMMRYARSDAPVLLMGESGTGKELAAAAIHTLSMRTGGFIPVNCAAIPETLIESELFGTERGAYTDAVSRCGAFERGDRGTVFLDEVGDMPPKAQAKVLRILEEREVSRLGATGAISINVRIVAATHRDLRRKVEYRAFREDLFYRLGVLPIQIPPLRERTEDIPALCSHFLESRGEEKTVASDAISKLMSHDWPGNVRELRNVLIRACLTSAGIIRAADIHFF